MNPNDIITAAQQGDLKQVILCVQNDDDPTIWNSQALSEAVIHNHMDVVKYLTPLSDVNANNAAALRNAFLHNNLEIIDFLWDRVDHQLIIEEDIQFSSRPTPFQSACQYGFFQHAVALLQYPLSRNTIRRSMHHLPKISNDPLCLTLWEGLLAQLREFGNDELCRDVVSVWYDKPLPGLNVLLVMAEHVADNAKNAQFFLTNLAQNPFVENHISAVFPLFDHIFDDLDDIGKRSIIEKTLINDPMLSRALIARSATTSLLCAAIVQEALYADWDTLNNLLGIWQRNPSIDDDEFIKIENTLSHHVWDAPEKVWTVVENFKQFLTPKVAQSFIWLQDNQMTHHMLQHCAPNCLNQAYQLLNDEKRSYFDDYRNRMQRSTIENALPHNIQAPPLRKI